MDQPSPKKFTPKERIIMSGCLLVYAIGVFLLIVVLCGPILSGGSWF